MTAKKKRVKRERPKPLDPAAFANVVARQIETAEIKTATPSRAQNKIQVRIAWTEPDGKPGLGYLSMDAGMAEKIGTKASGPSFQNFLDDVFRLPQWAKAVAIDKHYTDADWGTYRDDLVEDLKAKGLLDASSKIHELHKKAVAEIAKCAQAGVHKTQRRQKNQEKAKDYLMRNVLFAINNGLSDAEIHDIVNLAFVKHTQES